MFIHHPDGYLNLDGTLIALHDFIVDEPDYALPPGARGALYDPQTGRCVLTDGKNWTPWGHDTAELDRYIENAAMYEANAAERAAQ